MKKLVNKGLKSKKNFLIVTLIILVIFNGLLANTAFSQKKAQQRVLEGVSLFWEAKFEDAIEVLQEAIAHNALSKDELFSAHLYIGFSLLRLDGQPELIKQTFRQAVKANPQLKLDSFKIPPDLLNKFEEVRKGMICSFYITSDPIGAEIIGLSPEKEIKFKGLTPHFFEDLLVGTYDVIILKKEYQQKMWRASLSPAVVDTLDITLELKKKSFFKKWLPWVAGGGVVAASVVAIVSSKESSKTKPGLQDLPMPPDRPR